MTSSPHSRLSARRATIGASPTHSTPDKPILRAKRKLSYSKFFSPDRKQSQTAQEIPEPTVHPNSDGKGLAISSEHWEQIKSFCKQGLMVQKHGRTGYKKRLLRIKEDKLFWGTSHVRLKTVEALNVGQQRKGGFMRQQSTDSVGAALRVTILTHERELQLQFGEVAHRNFWIMAILFHLAQLQSIMTQLYNNSDEEYFNSLHPDSLQNIQSAFALSDPNDTVSIKFDVDNDVRMIVLPKEAPQKAPKSKRSVEIDASPPRKPQGRRFERAKSFTHSPKLANTLDVLPYGASSTAETTPEPSSRLRRSLTVDTNSETCFDEIKPEPVPQRKPQKRPAKPSPPPKKPASLNVVPKPELKSISTQLASPSFSGSFFEPLPSFVTEEKHQQEISNASSRIKELSGQLEKMWSVCKDQKEIVQELQKEIVALRSVQSDVRKDTEITRKNFTNFHEFINQSISSQNDAINKNNEKLEGTNEKLNETAIALADVTTAKDELESQMLNLLKLSEIQEEQKASLEKVTNDVTDVFSRLTKIDERFTTHGAEFAEVSKHVISIQDAFETGQHRMLEYQRALQRVSSRSRQAEERFSDLEGSMKGRVGELRALFRSTVQSFAEFQQEQLQKVQQQVVNVLEQERQDRLEGLERLERLENLEEKNRDDTSADSLQERKAEGLVLDRMSIVILVSVLLCSVSSVVCSYLSSFK